MHTESGVGRIYVFSYKTSRTNFQSAQNHRDHPFPLLPSSLAWSPLRANGSWSQTVNTFLNKSFLPSRSLDFVLVSGIILWFVHYPSAVEEAGKEVKG